MLYLKVPAVIYRAIRSVLSLYGQDGNIIWLQMDYASEHPKPILTFYDGKIKFNDSVGQDSVSFNLLKYLVKGLYPSE